MVKPCRRPFSLGPWPLPWLSRTIVLIAFALVAAGSVASDHESPSPGAFSHAHLIQIPLPISGTVDDQVKQQIDRVLDQISFNNDRPVLILEFLSSHQGHGSGSQFERSFALARYLTSDRMQGARTIAYLPQSLQGHAVLVAMACEEIIMHPDAEFGRAGIDEVKVDVTISSAYREIAGRARTIPVAIALGMLDPRFETVRIEMAAGTRYVLADEVGQIERETAITRKTTIIPRGEMGYLTGREMRLEHGFVSQLAGDRLELANLLDLPTRVLQADPLLRDGRWQPVQIRLCGAIDANLRHRVQWNIEESLRSNSVNFICLWIDSAGGSPIEILGLANFLAGLDSSRVRTVAYVPSEARANVSLIVFACDEVVMHEDAVVGGFGNYEMSPAEIGDVRSVLIDDLSRKKFSSWSLAVAMIDPSLVVYRYRLKGQTISQFFCDKEFAQQPDAARWEREDEIVSAGEVYQVDGHQAIEVGIAKHVVNSFDQFKRVYHLDNDPALVEPSWAEVIISALARPELAGTLVFIGFFALIFELMSPGLGAGGFVALICYLLFFWSQFLNGTAGWLEILLFLGGISCVALEVFVIPGFGIFGLGGGSMIIASLVLASQTFLQFPQNEYQLKELRDSLLVVAAAGAGFVVAVVVLRRYINRAPMEHNVVLAPPVGDDLVELQHRESLVDLEHLKDMNGTTRTKLTPAGKARFGDELIDVVSDGDLLPAGINVRVVEVRGNHVVVDRV